MVVRYEGNDFVCMEITPKMLMMRTDLLLIIPIENTMRTQNMKHMFKQNSFILGCSCTTWECVIQKKLF